jgi:hypothetical protein
MDPLSSSEKQPLVPKQELPRTLSDSLKKITGIFKKEHAGKP